MLERIACKFQMVLLPPPSSELTAARQEYLEHGKSYYKGVIGWIDATAKRHGEEIRFVGGTLTDVLTPDTTFTVDAPNRTIRIANHKDLTPIRPDGTIKDLDIISFCPDPSRHEEFMAEIKTKFSEDRRRGFPLPYISVEPTHYHDKGWTQRKERLQFVSTLDVKEVRVLGKEEVVEILSLRFDRINQTISWKSVDPWTAELSDGTKFTILNPIAHMLRYHMRVPSGPKKKDTEPKEYEQGKTASKMELLRKMARAVYEEGLRQGIDYLDETHYAPWLRFIDRMQNDPDKIIRLKAALTGTYWDTIGTAFSRGVGPLKHLQPLATRFTT